MKRLCALLLMFAILIAISSCKNEDNTSSNNDINNSEILCSNCTAKITLNDNFCNYCGFAAKNTSIINSSETPKENMSDISSTPNSNHTHDYGNEVITKKPTCTEQGIRTFYCSSCSSTRVEYIDATGHKWENATCVSERKCFVCNITDGEKLEHSYSNNNCTSCGKERISFSYEKNHFPIKVIETKGSRKGKVDILNAHCYIKNEEIYINVIVDAEKVDYGTRQNVVVKLISSNKNICATQLISPAWWSLPNGETSYDKCIVPWNDFYKLEPDTYQVVIELI